MLNLITRLSMLATVASAIFCVISVFWKAPAISSKIVLYGKAPDKLAIEAYALRRNRRFVVWFIAALALLIITIVISGRLPIVAKNGTEPGPEATPFPTATVSATPTPPPATPTAVPTANNSSSSSNRRSIYLDEIDPIISMPNNFFIDGWSDKKEFHIDEDYYDRGIGMLICETETKDEARVVSRDGTYSSDCREVFIEYALRLNYKTLSFKLGADDGDATRFGNEYKNGIAAVILSDATTNEVLFDTGWVTCKYSTKTITLDMSDVDVLRITFRSSGVVDGKRITRGLRFALVKPLLVLNDDY